LKEIQRKNKKESFALKDYVDLLINPVDLKKNREVKFNEDRFPTIKEYCDRCETLAEENNLREMNLPKKVVRS
jgi:hypothetical protein